MTSRKQNKPGNPIVTRAEGATFYCVACYKTYQDCRCPVYQSADTLRGTKSTTPGNSVAPMVSEKGAK